MLHTARCSPEHHLSSILVLNPLPRGASNDRPPVPDWEQGSLKRRSHSEETAGFLNFVYDLFSLEKKKKEKKLFAFSTRRKDIPLQGHDAAIWKMVCSDADDWYCKYFYHSCVYLGKGTAKTICD
ncbi:hypothetical protein XENORESO_017352 [Xenotaenia resolanae]|uniref:Uncharacterized protein n=1 Tax=Xenotaenia resolanae TaxID=208358 RepID=A0ABV0VXA0_9TELE